MAPIHDAVIDGDLDQVKRLTTADPALVNQGSDHWGEVVGIYGYLGALITPLHLASMRSNHLEMVTYLLDHGADIHSKDAEGKDALHHATYDGHLAVISLLVERGANVRNGSFFSAIRRGHLPVVSLLL